MSNESQNWLVQFGDGNRAFDWRKHNAGFNNDTPSFIDSISEVFGADGGVWNFGERPSPKPPGTMTVSVILEADESYNLQEELDSFYRAHDGQARFLYYAPEGTQDKTRWRRALAKPTNITANRPIGEGITHKAQVSYSLASPYWFAPRFNNQHYLTGEVALDAGATFGTADVENLSVGGSFTVHNYGTAPALPTLVFDNNSGTLGDFVFQRIIESYVVEEFEYAGTINTTTNQQLIVNARRHFCSDLANLTPRKGQRAFMSLPPGISTLRLASAGTLTGTPQVHVYFDNVYAA